MSRIIVPGGSSLAGLGGAAVYCFVALICAVAAVASVRNRQPMQYGVFWCLAASVFVLCVAMRLFGAEETLRTALRAWLQSSGIYPRRDMVQRPLAALTIIIVPLAMCWILFSVPARTRKPGMRALCLAGTGVLGMTCLIALRLISLHQVDALLYGPFRLNWFVDLGASLLVLTAASYYLWLVRTLR